MTKRPESGLKKVASEIRKEAARQLRGFPNEVSRQVARGWGQEFAQQLFATQSRHRRRAR